MPTTIVQVQRDWTLVRSGPVDRLSIQAINLNIDVVYVLSETIPTDRDAEGNFLEARAGHTLVITAPDNLYARCTGNFLFAELAVTEAATP